MLKIRQRQAVRIYDVADISDALDSNVSFIPFKGRLLTVPQGFTTVQMVRGGQKYDVLVRSSVVNYIANSGFGGDDPYEVLDDIREFYNDVVAFEDKEMQRGRTNIFSTAWATQARKAYHTNIMNCLVEKSAEPSDIVKLRNKHRKEISLLVDDIDMGVGDDRLDKLVSLYIEGGLSRANELDKDTKTSIAQRYYAKEHTVELEKRCEKVGYKPVPQFSKDTLKRFHLDDPYVQSRMKAIAAIVLETSEAELKASDIANVLYYVKVVQPQIVEVQKQKLSNQDIRDVSEFFYDRRIWSSPTVGCLFDSHYELLPEYRNPAPGEWQYDLGKKRRTKIIKVDEVKKYEDKGLNIDDLEQEIVDYVNEQGVFSEHLLPITRAYENFQYITVHDPGRQLDIVPKGDVNGST